MPWQQGLVPVEQQSHRAARIQIGPKDRATLVFWAGYGFVFQKSADPIMVKMRAKSPGSIGSAHFLGYHIQADIVVFSLYEGGQDEPLVQRRPRR